MLKYLLIIFSFFTFQCFSQIFDDQHNGNISSVSAVEAICPFSHLEYSTGYPVDMVVVDTAINYNLDCSPCIYFCIFQDVQGARNTWRTIGICNVSSITCYPPQRIPSGTKTEVTISCNGGTLSSESPLLYSFIEAPSFVSWHPTSIQRNELVNGAVTITVFGLNFLGQALYEIQPDNNRDGIYDASFPCVFMSQYQIHCPIDGLADYVGPLVFNVSVDSTYVFQNSVIDIIDPNRYQGPSVGALIGIVGVSGGAILLMVAWAHWRVHKPSPPSSEDLSQYAPSVSVYGTMGSVSSSLSRQSFPSDLEQITKRASMHVQRIPKEEIRLGPRIGIGSFADVFSATWRGTPVAVKSLRICFSPDNGEAFRSFVDEAALLCKLAHPNICQFLGVVLHEDMTAIVMELLPRGNLHSFLMQFQPQQSPPTAVLGASSSPDSPRGMIDDERNVFSDFEPREAPHPRSHSRSSAPMPISVSADKHVNDSVHRAASSDGELWWDHDITSGASSDSEDEHLLATEINTERKKRQADLYHRLREGIFGSHIVSARSLPAPRSFVTPRMSMNSATLPVSPTQASRAAAEGDESSLEWWTPARVMCMARDIASGMAYLHNHAKIIHRDLKSVNLLISENWTIKVADFGLSKLNNFMSSRMTVGVGTLHWMAPEMILGRRYNEKVDVYSFGIILWELITLRMPFSHLSAMAIMWKVAHENYRPPIPNKVPATIKSLLESCWDPIPDRRPSFDTIIERIDDFLWAEFGDDALF